MAPAVRTLTVILACGAACLASGITSAHATQPTAATPPAPPAAAEPKVALRPVWEKGQSASFDMRLETRVKANILSNEGGQRSQLYRQEARLSRRVLKADAGGAVLAITIERLRMQVSADGEVLWHDSASTVSNNDASDLKQAIDIAVGRPITITLNPEGEVVSIEGNQDLEPMGDKGTPPKPIPQALLGDQVIRGVWRPLYGIPGAPESGSIGEAWTIEDKVTDRSMGIFNTTLTSVLGERSGDRARIDVTGTTRLIPAVGPSAVKGELQDHAINATYVWDVAARSLVSLVGRQSQVIEGERGTLKQRVETVVLRQITRVEPGTPDADWGAAAPPRGPVVPEPPKPGSK